MGDYATTIGWLAVGSVATAILCSTFLPDALVAILTLVFYGISTSIYHSRQRF